MKPLLTIVGLIVATCIFAQTATARLITGPKCDSLKCRLSSQTQNLRYAKYVCRWGGGETRKWACSAMVWLARERGKTIARIWTNRIPHKAQWQCIHRYEGSWTDPNAPYYGGLQMDLEFIKDYGKDLYRTKGTADHWTPYEQMMVAERAFKKRGFWPWPNTARLCGLL